jgi:hypothetical protein
LKMGAAPRPEPKGGMFCEPTSLLPETNRTKKLGRTIA